MKISRQLSEHFELLLPEKFKKIELEKIYQYVIGVHVSREQN